MSDAIDTALLAAPRLFPFSALVGLDDLKMALLLAAVDARLSVLARGDKGAGKTTAARALGRLSGGPFINLPLGATEDRLLGGLDVERALAGQPALKRGLLAEAHGGVLYVDEVNLLPDHLADALLDAVASGQHIVEREGFSVRQETQFALIGSMNPEEGALRPQLLDRFALAVDIVAPMDVASRRLAVERRLQFEMQPDDFLAAWEAEETALVALLRDARARVGAVSCSGAQLDAISAWVCAEGVRSLRADLAIVRASRALAALEGAPEVTTAHVEAVLPLALYHRAPASSPRRASMSTPPQSSSALPPPAAQPPPASTAESGSDSRRGGEPQQVSAADDDARARSAGDQSQGSAKLDEGSTDEGSADDGARNDSAGDGSAGDDSGRDDPARDENTRDGGAAADGADDGADEDGSEGRGTGNEGAEDGGIVTADPGRVFASRAIGAPRLAVAGRVDLAASEARDASAAPGSRAARRDAGLPRGPAIGSRRSDDPREIDLRATLVQAVARTGAPRPSREDLHDKRRAPHAGTRFLFVIDSSGSHAIQQRMRLVKGAVTGLLDASLRRHDEVVIVAFRGAAAEVVLEPTRSAETARLALEYLPTGGRTPLAHALELAAGYVTAASVLVLLTDGRANVPTRGTDAWSDALQAAAAITCPALVIDSEAGAAGVAGAGTGARQGGRGTTFGRARAIAEAMGAACVPLDGLDEVRLVELARRPPAPLPAASGASGTSSSPPPRASTASPGATRAEGEA